MFKNVSLQARQSLLQLGQSRIKPTCQSMVGLRKVNQHWLKHELPIRYMHLIKLLSMKKCLEPVLARVLRDVDILQGGGENPQLLVPRLRRRMQKTLDLVDELGIRKSLLDQIYSLELSVQLLLDEWIAIDKKVPLVETIDVVAVAREAAAKSKLNGQTVKVVSTSDQPIETSYIRSHLFYIIQDLIHQSWNQRHLNILVSQGKEDICVRMTNDELATLNSGPVKFKISPYKQGRQGLAESMVRYWGGDMEKVVMGPHSTTYVHLKKEDRKERIPPILETVPHKWMENVFKK